MKLTIKIIRGDNDVCIFLLRWNLIYGWRWWLCVKENISIYLIISIKCEKIHFREPRRNLPTNNFLKIMISHVWYDYFCLYKTGLKSKHNYTMKFSFNMKWNYIMISMLSIGICGLVFASTVVLSLIPLYTPSSDGIVLTKDKLCSIVSLWWFLNYLRRTRSFQYKASYNRIAKRSLSSGLESVDASSFQELNHLVCVWGRWFKNRVHFLFYLDSEYINKENACASKCCRECWTSFSVILIFRICAF